MKQQLSQDCSNYILAISDAMDILRGKWKIKILIVLLSRPYRFTDILGYLEKLTPRVLSKELNELEINGLVKRIVLTTKPVSVEYRITDSGRTLQPVIEALYAWGAAHRKGSLFSTIVDKMLIIYRLDC